MAFTKIVAPTSKEMFISQILEMIFSGELKVGEKLPTERELSETMEINRSIVHAGLDELKRMGFICIEPRKGVYVTDYAKAGNFETLTAIVKYAGGDFDDQTSVNMVEFRNAIEGGAMIRLAKRGKKEDFETLRGMIENMKQIASGNISTKEYAKMMCDFHTELTRLSGNQMFSLVGNSFEMANLVLWERCVKFWGVETILQQETHIVDLLEKGKGHEAALFIENQLEQYLEANNIKV